MVSKPRIPTETQRRIGFSEMFIGVIKLLSSLFRRNNEEVYQGWTVIVSGQEQLACETAEKRQHG